jgi:hypothetical protein
MLKKILITLAVAAAAVLTPEVAYAQQNCVTVYGGGVVCGAETEVIVHKPVEAGLAENLMAVAAVSLTAAGALQFISKRISTRLSGIS